MAKALTNQEVIQKAAIVLNDLNTAGRLNEEQSTAFIRMLIDQPTIMGEARTVHFNGDRKKLEKIGMGQRVLHGAEENVALADGKQTKPSFDKVSLECKEFIAEIEITDDTLENNIEGTSIEDTIMNLLAQRVSLDIEELIINGNTSILPATDDFLSVLNGIRKQAVSHIVDWNKAGVSKEMFKAAKKAMPAKYRRAGRDMRFYVSDDIEIEWIDALANRTTGQGDATLLSGTVPPAYGIPVKGIAMLTEYNAGTTEVPVMVSDAILTHPQNVVIGISRDIRVEADRDIRRRVNFIVLTLKMDVKFEEEDAVVKVTKILQN